VAWEAQAACDLLGLGIDSEIGLAGQGFGRAGARRRFMHAGGVPSLFARWADLTRNWIEGYLAAAARWAPRVRHSE